MKVLVVFASETGHTRGLAEAFAAGAREGGAEVTIAPADEAAPDSLLAADAIALGSAVHMGGIASSLRGFFERSAPLWLGGRLVGKLGTAFVSAGLGGRGGAELALVAMHSFLAEQGCLCVPMPRGVVGFARAGSHWGTVLDTGPNSGASREDALAAARAQGGHLAACTARWLRGARSEEEQGA